MAAEPSRQSIFLADADATQAAGSTLARAALTATENNHNQPLVFFLQGDLGAGKTTLSQGFLRGCGHTGAVKSPTYTLVEPYECLSRPVYHFDLYRLADPEELEFLGFRDYLAQSCTLLIEWPQKGAGYLPAADVAVNVTVARGAAGMGRQLQLAAGSPVGAQVLADIKTLAADLAAN